MTRTRSSVAVPLLLLALVACGGKKGSRASDAAVVTAPATPAPPRDLGPSAPAGPTWSLAPAAAVGGVVINEGAGQAILEAARRWLALAEMHPLGAELGTKLRAAVREELGHDPLDPAAWRKLGLDPARPAAVFFDADGEPVLAVVPVANRKAWKAATGAKSAKQDGLAVDLIAGLVCAELEGRYLCGKTPATLREAVAPHDPPVARRVAAIPASQRGGVEGHLQVAGPGGAAGLQQGLPVDSIWGSLRIEPDGLVVQLAAKLPPPAVLADVMATVPSADELERARGGTGFMRARLPIALVASALPDVSLAGLSLRTELRQLTGEVFWVTRLGTDVGGALHWQVADPARARRTLEKLCSAGLQPGIVWDAAAEACHISVPQGPLTTKMWLRVDGPWIVADMGDPPPSAGARSLVDRTASAETREMVSGGWTFVSWAVGFDIASELPQEVRAMLRMVAQSGKLDAETVLGAVDFASFLGASVYEMGLAFGVRADGLDLVFRITTFAGESGAARAAFDQALALRARGELAGYRAALAELAKTAPADGLLARQAALVTERYVGLGFGSVAVLGMGAAVAIPAFMKYIRKSKTTEVVFNMKRIHAAARAHALEHGGAVPPSAPMTPAAGGCCGQPGDRCPGGAKVWTHATWKALDFSIDDPHYYSYEFQSDGSQFTARAIGDLDCDGILSTFEILGERGADGTLREPKGFYKNEELE